MSVRFEYLPTNGIRLHTALAGPDDGNPVFLLHGFPDAWFGWEAQIGPLAEAGFRVIVPDQRGYNLSDKPKGVSSYRMETLVEDIIGLADGFGYERFQIADGIRQVITRGSAIALRHVHIVDLKWLVKTSSGKNARLANRDKYLKETST